MIKNKRNRKKMGADERDNRCVFIVIKSKQIEVKCISK